MTGVLIALAVLAAGGLIALLLNRWPRAAAGVAMLAVGLAGALAIAASVPVLLGRVPPSAQALAWPLPLGAAHLALDGLSAWFLLAIGLLSVAVAIYSPAYIGRQRTSAVFGALLCALVAALILFICAADAVLFLIGWEGMALAAFFLVAFHHERPEARRGAWMYLVATHLGTALFVLPLFGMLVAESGTTAFAAFEGATASADRATLILLVTLGLIGFGTKAGLMPMHVWLPAAHPVAPTPVSALLSGIVVKTGIYALLRLLTWLPPLPPACGYLVLAIGMISGVMGVLYALAQHDLKRLLAYHTVENIGIIALGIGMGMLGQSAGQPAIAALGYAGALLHVTNHALFKGLLFLSAGAVLHGSGTAQIERLGGLARGTPVNALMFLIGAVAICGLPPLNGFLSEWVIYGSLFAGSIKGMGASGGVPALALVSLALMGGLALACFAKVFGIVFLGEPRDSSLPVHATPMLMKAGMAVLAVACVFIGVLPGLWVPLTHSAVGQLTHLAGAEVGSNMQTVLAPAGTLSWLAVVLALFIGVLAYVRRRVLSRAARRDAVFAASTSTWGCGYARPTARMQYTAYSFASPLIASFRALLWPVRHLAAPAGPFPAAGRVETHTEDIAEHDLFAPIFRAAERVFAMVRTVSWKGQVEPLAPAHAEPHKRRGPLRALLAGGVAPLRRGNIQVYLSFIVVTLVLLFLLEAIWGPRAQHRAPYNPLHHTVSSGTEP